MKRSYRVGVIGRTGKGNYGHGLDKVWAEIPRCQVIAVADEHVGGREKTTRATGAERSYSDYRVMLEKEQLDIVAIAPRWIDHHFAMAKSCIEHGCHIYMEKPFVPKLKQADELVRLCEMKHVKLVIAHQTRYSPTTKMVQKLIEAGEIGDVLEIRARGKEDRRGGGEDLWVLGTHLMDLMRFYFGDVESCFAEVRENGKPITQSDVKEGNEGIGPLAGDSVAATYAFRSGARGFFASQRNQSVSPSRFGMQIFGSQGVIECFTGFLTPAYLLADPSWSPGRTGSKWQIVTSAGIDKPEPRKDSGLHAGNVAAVTDLIDAIENDRRPVSSVYDARAATEMIVAVFESHRQRRSVSVPLKNRDNPLTTLDS